jgi:RNA polymerase sigma-70 factor, ECF subfamily
MTNADGAVEINPPAHLRCWERVADESLLHRLRERDPSGYEELVRLYRPRMHSVALRILKSEHDAADAVQEALVAAFRSIERFDGQSRLSTWLHAIVVNVCRMQLRSRRRRPVCSLEGLGHDVASVQCRRIDREERPAPADVDDSREFAGAALRLVEELPAMYREVIRTRVLDGHDTLVSSRLLRTSESVVKTRLHRARRMLQRMARAEHSSLSRFAER